MTACNNVLVLDADMELIKRFTPIDRMPTVLDATSEYIAYGNYVGKVAFYSRHGSDEPTVSLKIKS